MKESVAGEALNLNHLRLFAVVAREGSIASAARHLGLAQPTISVQLRALERAVGVRLLERRGRGLALTEQGRVLARHGEELLALADRAAGALVGSGVGAGRFAIGAADSLPPFTTARLLRPAFRLDPQPALTVRVDKTERLLAELAAHTLDMLLLDHPAPASLRVRAFSHLLGDSGVTVFAVPPLAARLRRGFPGSLTGAPFLLQTDGAALRQSLELWLVARRIRPAVVAEVEDAGLMKALGAGGLGAFAAPTLVERELRRQHGVHVVGRLPEVRERFYAVTAERRLTHPAALAISEGARGTLRPARQAPA